MAPVYHRSSKNIKMTTNQPELSFVSTAALVGQLMTAEMSLRSDEPLGTIVNPTTSYGRRQQLMN